MYRPRRGNGPHHGLIPALHNSLLWRIYCTTPRIMKGCPMHRTLLRPLGGTTPSPSARFGVAGILQRSRPLRCLLISCLSVAAGWGLLTLFLPALSPESTASVLHSHLPSAETPPLLFWMRLCVSRFPFWLLLAIAGFTRFSGGLTSAVTVYRGVCDGAVFGLMSAAAMNRFSK